MDAAFGAGHCSVNVVSVWYLSGVTVLLQWCYRRITVLLKCCYSVVTLELQWCYNGVTVVLTHWSLLALGLLPPTGNNYGVRK
jgi:hypothetical protein